MKVLLLFFLLTSINFSFSQEINSLYRFKIEKESKESFDLLELDSLVLYNDGTFYRKKLYSYHEILINEYKGLWEIMNDKLKLIVTKHNGNGVEVKWKKVAFKLKYRLKKYKIVPFYGFEYKARKLKKF